MNKVEPIQDQYDVISFGEIIFFFISHWKKFFLSGVIGIVVGLGCWVGLGQYTAQAILVNNNALDLVSWRSLQTNLPVLAAQFVEKQKIKSNEEQQLRRMSEHSWWKENVLPGYSLSKDDVKELTALAGLNKGGLDSTDFKQLLLYLQVNAKGITKEIALADLHVSVDFIRQGSAYILLKNLISKYESTFNRNEAELQRQITSNEIELQVLRGRVQDLESLAKQFPEDASGSPQQVVQVNDSNAKFMPINKQLIAVNQEIYKNVEQLQSLRSKLEQMKFLRDFVLQAQSFIEKENKGLELADRFLAIEAAMRSKASPKDFNAQQMLNRIKDDVVQLRVQFSTDLIANSSNFVARSNPILPAMGGFLSGSFLMLVYLLCMAAFKSYKVPAPADNGR